MVTYAHVLGSDSREAEYAAGLLTYKTKVATDLIQYKTECTADLPSYKTKRAADKFIPYTVNCADLHQFAGAL